MMILAMEPLMRDPRVLTRRMRHRHSTAREVIIRMTPTTSSLSVEPGKPCPTNRYSPNSKW